MSGKRQRPSHFQIDEKTLEYKQNPQKKKQVVVDSQQQIKQRVIYKIKGHGGPESSHQGTQTKPKFTLFDTTPKTAESEHKQQKSDAQKSQQIDHKKEQTKQTKQQLKNSQDKKQQPQKSNNIFNFSLGNSNNIFGNGIGIFTKNPSTDGIFSKNNIFSKDNKPLGEPDSQNGSKPGNSIFGASQSIFSFSNGVPPVKKQLSFPTFSKSKSNDDNQDGGEEDSKQLEADQKQTTDPSKSTGTYEYHSQCQTLFLKKAIKVKKDSGDLIENTQVVVQQDKQKKVSWVVVRLIATKNSIITGHLIKGKSEVKKLGNKQENVTVSVMTIKEKHPEIHIIKIQFQKPEQGKQFKQIIEKIIS